MIVTVLARNSVCHCNDIPIYESIYIEINFRGEYVFRNFAAPNHINWHCIRPRQKIM